MALFGDDLILKYPAMQKFISSNSFIFFIYFFFSVYIPFFEGSRQSETEHESVWRYPWDAICCIWRNAAMNENTE